VASYHVPGDYAAVAAVAGEAAGEAAGAEEGT
jgi:hypothetical protein